MKTLLILCAVALLGCSMPIGVELVYYEGRWMTPAEVQAEKDKTYTLTVTIEVTQPTMVGGQVP